MYSSSDKFLTLKQYAKLLNSWYNYSRAVSVFLWLVWFPLTRHFLKVYLDACRSISFIISHRWMLKMSFQILLGLSKDPVSEDGDLNRFTSREKFCVVRSFPYFFFVIKLDFVVDDIISFSSSIYNSVWGLSWQGVGYKSVLTVSLAFIRSYNNLLDDRKYLEMDFHGPFFHLIIRVHIWLKSADRKQCSQIH